jgi:hypothetical protein
MVITVPHRFDKDYNSCVNEEVRNCNRSVINVAKNLNEVTEVNEERGREGKRLLHKTRFAS